MQRNEPPKRRIKTAMRVFEIIQLIDELKEPTFTDLTEHVQMADSTLYDYLVTLEHIGYIIAVNGTYRLTLRFFDHGVKIRDEYSVLSKAKPVLEQVAEESRRAAWLEVEERGKVVHLAGEFGDQAIETHARLGKHEYMHCLAGGKAVLAEYPEKRVREIVKKHGLPARTPYTITSLDKLLDELADIRKQGYATNEQEIAEGAVAVGAAIVVEGYVHGAVVIPGPLTKMQSNEERQKIIELVKNASNEIELKLAYE